VTQDPSPLYSERLGAIADVQFAAAAERLGLGEFVRAEPVKTGLFGQNVFLTTTAGEFVFRGAPHWYGGRRDDRYQFAKEALFIGLAHEHTGAPVPWPARYDPAPDIFGWPYLVMPRMPGACFNERSIRKALAPHARREVAASLGATLAELQRLTAPAAGDYDPDTDAVAQHADGYGAHLIRSLSTVAQGAEAAGVMTAADMDWTRELAREACDLPARPVSFVHGDYKLDNMTVAERDGAWRVTGVFDFHTARFGDSARDIVRAACAYLDTEPELAQAIIEAWRGGGGDEAGLAPWLPLYVASERSSIWAGFVKPDARPAWSAGKTFRSWAEGYLERLTALI
jgi:aminoglycoside phosphotransferase (APT) family kinase protein